MADTITISKIEYRQLKMLAQKYKLVRTVIAEDINEEFTPSDVSNPTRGIQEMRSTRLYKEPFLKRLKQSLNEAKQGQGKLLQL